MKTFLTIYESSNTGAIDGNNLGTDIIKEKHDNTKEIIRSQKSKKGRPYNGQKKGRPYNGQKKGRPYNGQKKGRPYNGQKKKDKRTNNDVQKYYTGN